MGHKLDPYQGIIEARLEVFPRFLAKWLYDEVRAAGYTRVRPCYGLRSVGAAAEAGADDNAVREAGGVALCRAPRSGESEATYLQTRTDRPSR